MGFDMVMRDLYLPAGAGLDLAAGKATISGLCRQTTLDDLRLLLNEAWIDDEVLADPRDWTDAALTARRDVVRAAAEEQLHRLLDRFAASLSRRDVAQFRFDNEDDDGGVDAYVTGGVSIGDSPTDAFEMWDIVCNASRFPGGWADRIGAACGLLHPRGGGPATATVTFHAWAVPAGEPTLP